METGEDVRRFKGEEDPANGSINREVGVELKRKDQQSLAGLQPMGLGIHADIPGPFQSHDKDKPMVLGAKLILGSQPIRPMAGKAHDITRQVPRGGMPARKVTLRFRDAPSQPENRFW